MPLRKIDLIFRANLAFLGLHWNGFASKWFEGYFAFKPGSVHLTQIM
jgi:hypothetical protein